MKKKMRRTWLLVAVFYLTSCFLFTSLSFGQEMPKPGEVIDKSNYNKYSHLFPKEYLPMIENGFGGLWNPASVKMKVVETKPVSQPKVFLVFSEKNRGKYSIGKDGEIVGGFDYNGLPFPGVTKDDKDFATKLMWNHEYRYQKDDWAGPVLIYGKRKGEQVTTLGIPETRISFVGRMYDDPKPQMKNASGLEETQLITFTEPVSVRNFQTLTYRYLDPKKPDDTYMYLPTMRRVLRGEAGVRSTPIQGMILSLDDMMGFSGKVTEFTYQFVREQKIIGLMHAGSNIEVTKKLRDQSGKQLPFYSDNYEIFDVYVIEIKSKDARYPQSMKQIYIEKESLQILYAVALDRAGNLWKEFFYGYDPRTLADGDKAYPFSINYGVDIQFGFGNYAGANFKVNGNGLTYADFMPSAMLKKGQ